MRVDLQFSGLLFENLFFLFLSFWFIIFVDMKVITIGFSKTGTKSLDDAYRILGFKVSGTGRNLSELRYEWLRFFEGKGSPEDLKMMYKDYDAASDVPVYLYWKLFVHAFPDIKLVLPIRDVESWLKSFTNQVQTFNDSAMSFPLTLFSSKARGWFDFEDKFFRRVFRGKPSKAPWFRRTIPVFDEDTCRRVYLEFIEDVRKNSRPGQLLILDLKDGWEPLCKFLGHEIPDVPFPHLNKGGSITQYRIKHDPFVQEMFNEMYIAWAVIVLVAALVITGLCFFSH